MDRDSVEPAVDDFPGQRASEWAEYHHEFAAPSTYVYDFVWDSDAPAIGPFCTDIDGNVLMDWTGHVGAMPLGYNNPKILNPLSALDLIDPTKIAGQDFYTTTGDDPEIPGPTGLMDRLTEISSQYDMDTVFLSNSGAEAVENAIAVTEEFLRATGVLPGGTIQRPKLPVFRLGDPVPKRAAERYEVFAENFQEVAAGEAFAAVDGESVIAGEAFHPVLMSSYGYDDVFGYTAERAGTLGTESDA